MFSNKKMANSHSITATRRQFTGLLGGSGLLALTGCGGGGSEASAPTPAPAPTTSAPTAPPTPAPVTDASPISLLAGDIGGPGNIDGTGIGARFGHITGVAHDKGGNLYISDPSNYAVRKVSAAGVVTTLVKGSGNSSVLGGLTVDSAGNVYIVSSKLIYKISTVGVVAPLALTVNGLPWNADFVRAIAIDKADNLYVAMNDSTVRKIDPAGNVIILAGQENVAGLSNGVGNRVGFSSLDGIAVDGVGNVYVTEFARHTIRKITPVGEVSTFAGDPLGGSGWKDGQGSEARFTMPHGLAVDAADNILVTDASGVIRRISPLGLVSSYGKTRGYSGFNSLAVDQDGTAYVGNIYMITRIDAMGVATPLAGLSASLELNSDGRGATARFNQPNDLALDATGNAFVIDSGWRLRKVSKEGEVTTSDVWIPSKPLYGVVADTVGNAYIAQVESQFNSVQGRSSYVGVVLKMASNGELTTLWRSDTVEPSSIAVDGLGNVYVSGKVNYSQQSSGTWSFALVKLSPTGLELSRYEYVVLVSASDYYGEDMPLEVDAQGSLFLAFRNRVRKFSAFGTLVAEYGAEGVVGAVDGSGVTARFGNIKGLALDAAGNLFVADFGNHAIRKISPDGKVITVVGRPGAEGIALGDLPGSLYQPRGVAFDANGTLFVTSAGAVLKVNLPR